MTSGWPVAPSRQRPGPRPVGSRSTIGMVNARDKRGDRGQARHQKSASTWCAACHPAGPRPRHGPCPLVCCGDITPLARRASPPRLGPRGAGVGWRCGDPPSLHPRWFSPRRPPPSPARPTTALRGERPPSGPGRSVVLRSTRRAASSRANRQRNALDGRLPLLRAATFDGRARRGSPVGDTGRRGTRTGAGADRCWDDEIIATAGVLQVSLQQARVTACSCSPPRQRPSPGV